MGGWTSSPKQQKFKSAPYLQQDELTRKEFETCPEENLHDNIVTEHVWSCNEHQEDIDANTINKITNIHLFVKRAMQLFGEDSTSVEFSELIYYYSTRLLQVQQHENYKYIQETVYQLSDYEILAVLYFCESEIQNDQILENTDKWNNLYNHLFNAILKLHKCFHFEKYENNTGYQQLYFGHNEKCDELYEMKLDAIASFTTGFGTALTTASGSRYDDDGFVLIIDNADICISNGSLIAADVEWISLWRKIISLPVCFKSIRQLTNEQIKNYTWLQKHSVYVTLEYNCLHAMNEYSPLEHGVALCNSNSPKSDITKCFSRTSLPKRIRVIDLIRRNIFSYRFMRQKTITFPTNSKNEAVEREAVEREAVECKKCVIKDRIIKAQHQTVYHSTMGYVLLANIYNNVQKHSKSNLKNTISNNSSSGNYDPTACCRARGVVRISFKLRKQILSTIKTAFSDDDLVKYMDKSLALQFYGDNATIGATKVINFDFYDKDNDKELYCIMTRQNESKDRGFKWKMENKLYFVKELDVIYKIPKSSRNTNEFIRQLNLKQEILNTMKNANQWRNIIRKAKWHQTPIFSATNKNRKMTLSLTKQVFTDQISQIVVDTNNNLIPMLLFDDNNNAIIEYLWIVRIESDIDIGISLTYDLKHKRVKVTGIHLDKDSIYGQHLLISSQHTCHCLDNFKSYITDLSIVLKQNEETNYKNQCNELLNILSSIANTSVIDDLLYKDVNLIDNLLLQNGGKLPAIPTHSDVTMQSIDLTAWIMSTLRKCCTDNCKWRQYWKNFKTQRVTNLEAIILLYQEYEQNILDNWISLIPDIKPRMQFLEHLTIRLNS